ncbi:MAG: hypothetical protein ACRD2X_00305 [Vicinamibacteraceae bacterium]
MLPPRVKRRTFLQAALAQLPWIPLVAQLGCRKRSPTAKPDAVVATYFSGAELAAVHQIGERFLHTAAPGASLADAYELLAPTVELIERSASDEEALAVLQEAVHADFVNGTVVSMEGWTLSRTELHVCALSLPVFAAKSS